MMSWSRTTCLLSVAVIGTVSTDPPQYPNFCKPGENCWPSDSELQALSDALNPDQIRNLTWPGGDSPRTSAVPFGSPGNQPLFGMTDNLKPLYVADPNARPDCYVGKLGSDFCKQSTRNLPKAGWQPSLIAWPLNSGHVQTLVAFAKQHNLCVSVAGTGHDYVNRHTCDQGLFIRTSLLKAIEWDTSSQNKFGNPEGCVKLGAGIVLSEAHESGARQSPPRFVASGWAQTVGVVGWSVGGGHGPFGVSKGFGVDNLLEVELVLANGTLATANAEENPDLFWALRGGGGSVWGVITAVTFRAHIPPAEGYTQVVMTWANDMCKGKAELDSLMEDYVTLTKQLSDRWSGMAYFTPKKTKEDNATCGATWTAFVKYNFLGPADHAEVKHFVDEIGHDPVSSQIENYGNYWDVVRAKPLSEDMLIPTPLPVTPTTVGLPSVAVAREDTDSLVKHMKTRMHACLEGVCSLFQLYNDMPNTISSAVAPDGATSIHPAFRTALLHVLHYMADDSLLDEFYSLGASSYFAETTFNLDGWKHRYWGDNYDQLLRVKLKYDPDGRFWCHHCVGADYRLDADSDRTTMVLV